MKNIESIKISAPKVYQQTEINLVASKSESNRALIINALAKGQGNLHNLSEARDTRTMLRLLSTQNEILDVLDAGTTMRFLTAYYAVSGQQKMLTGTPRMQERPIKVLVDALRQLGCNIIYKKNEGFPPIETLGFDKQMQKEISVRGDISSQYISALLMIAPVLPEGLKLNLTGTIGSRPYINMTIAQMQQFGAKVQWIGENSIEVLPVPYTPANFTVESDWSGASYWYSIAALSKKTFLQILGLREKSLQGDSAIADIMQYLGVETAYFDDGLALKVNEKLKPLVYDFSACPDLAQTVAVTCAGLGVPCTMTGLESLRIKETDRIAALQTELKKIGANLTEPETGRWVITGGGLEKLKSQIPVFDTYDDHRMAMAFAPLAALSPIVIKEPHVVEKSYPSYWEDIQMAGFHIG